MTSNLEILIEDIARAVGRFWVNYIPPKKPGKFTLSVTSQLGPETMIVTATLPAKTALDVSKFVLHYAIDGGAEVVAESTGDPITFSAPTGSTVIATFTEVDASGNISPPSDPETLVVLDTIAPGKPGAFGLSVTAEEPLPTV